MSSSAIPSPPKPYQHFSRDYPEIIRAYEELGKLCHEQGSLEPQTRELIKLGIAIGAGLESAAKAHIRLALAEGVSPEELKHTALLATTTIGFPSMMRAMSWVNEILAQGAS